MKLTGLGHERVKSPDTACARVESSNRERQVGGRPPDLWFERVVRSQCRGKALLCRYADEFVCAFASREDAERFFALLPKRLAKFGLQVAPEKTQVVRFSRSRPESEHAHRLSWL